MKKVLIVASVVSFIEWFNKENARLQSVKDKQHFGKTFNADVNGALNIMRKSSVVDLSILYSRGEVDTPIRIRIT